jgi:hypothetical protein
MLAAVTITCLALAAVPAARAADVQLGLIIDGSSSINDLEWTTLRTQAADAIETLRTDGTVELTVIRFGFEAFVQIAPTLVTEANRNGLADSVRNMPRPVTPLSPAALAAIDLLPPDVRNELNVTNGAITGGTNFEDAFLETGSAIFGSSFSTGALQFLNMLTDGNPTVDNDIVLGVQTVNASLVLGADPDASAIAARNDLVTMGIELLSFEAIGFLAQDLALMRDSLAFPGPGAEVSGPGFSFPPLPPEPGAQGFVVAIAGFDEVGAALDAKFRAADVAAPEPAASALLLPGLLGLRAASARIR